MQVGRAGRGGGSGSALVLVRESDMRLLHSLKHSCDCDAVAVKRILQALLDAAHAAMAHDAKALQQNSQTGKSSRASTVAAKRKRQAGKAHKASPAPGEASGHRKKKIGRKGEQPSGKAAIVETLAIDGSSSESSAGSSDSDGPESSSDEDFEAHGQPGV